MIVTNALKGLSVDVDRAVWRKSSRSGPFGDNCVEVALFEGGVAVRDSFAPRGEILLFTNAEWRAFTHAVRDGELGG